MSGNQQFINGQWQDAQPLGMQCEYGNCKRSGKDYERPKHLQEKGWEDESIYLCEDHAKELKVTP